MPFDSFMGPTENFYILDMVDSTNNYAMGVVHAGLAKHGMAWFANSQFSGKGQRGKSWVSEPGQNIIMSVVIEPAAIFHYQPFLFNMAISNACFNFLSDYFPSQVAIKWPNDLFLGDRKAGGILIENNYQGKHWKWAVIGIGINVNQDEFPEDAKRAVSMKQCSGNVYNVIELAKILQHKIIEALALVDKNSIEKVVSLYNSRLYLLNKVVKLRKENRVFETNIAGVNVHGQLLTIDTLPGVFEFGEVEWIFDEKISKK